MAFEALFKAADEDGDKLLNLPEWINFSKKIKETKIGKLDMDFKIYFLDKVGNYTIEDLGTDRVLDDITGETSRIDFEEEIEMGWADIDNYFNFLSKADKNDIKEKTERKKEMLADLTTQRAADAGLTPPINIVKGGNIVQNAQSNVSMNKNINDPESLEMAYRMREFGVS